MSNEIIFKPISPNLASQLNPVSLAFVGDAVYTLYVRTHFCLKSTAKSGLLHKESTEYVKATAQSEALGKIENMLNEDEKLILKRARNAKINSASRHATLSEYKKSTAFEAILGYLYITGQTEKLNEILNIASNNFKEN